MLLSYPSSLRIHHSAFRTLVMPELPEVETVARDLRPLLVGRTITAVTRSKLKLRNPWWPAGEKAYLIGQRVLAIHRRAKYLRVELTGGGCLLVHLGMTGQFTVVPASAPTETHTHFVFELDDGKQLRFRDARRFGSVELHASDTAAAATLDSQLGWEPNDIDPVEFTTGVRSSKRALKARLLDQTFVAGIGNIYADESLFRAKIHPETRGVKVSIAGCDVLRIAIQQVIAKAIESRGSTIRDYVGGSGLRGGFQHEFAVYGRTGEACVSCATTIQVIRVAGRSSHFCPKCQRKK